MKKLYKSRENKIVAGICGGIGEYYDIDPVVVRVVSVFLLFITGIIPFLLAYLIIYFIVPKNTLSR